ncbi:unnamed protein product [Acanthoscelides obtectus]|uniref:Uncharacterized protein n=1 Tax=Acanthoscelides obtectus TaxID=200917 RepID=A0A9P0KU54_ACAOB|nr:unnamed protein product [Acanthoscelides obtectus]CAK1659117.1 hypothetical protein AOBTE_LOCUS21286 [Acanthoscelides obtectus]
MDSNNFSMSGNTFTGLISLHLLEFFILGTGVIVEHFKFSGKGLLLSEQLIQFNTGYPKISKQFFSTCLVVISAQLLFDFKLFTFLLDNSMIRYQILKVFATFPPGN